MHKVTICFNITVFLLTSYNSYIKTVLNLKKSQHSKDDAVEPIAVRPKSPMFVDEVVIDGFKSYASRTVIGKFDSKFNAITGLNGSGKSNILDAICFVLGIGMDKVSFISNESSRGPPLTNILYSRCR